MGDAETTVSAVPADLTLSEEQLDDFARLLAKCLGRDNTTQLAREAGGPDVVQQAGNDVGDVYAYVRAVAGALQKAGRISQAIQILYDGVHRNGPMAFGVRRILSGGRLDSDKAVEAFVNEFQPLLSSASMMELLQRVGRTVCAVALDAPHPFGGLRGSGFLIAPDKVITNFHVLEPFLEVDLQTKVIRPVGPGDKIFFFFDYMLKPEPAVPPEGKQASVCVTAAQDWLVQARARLDKDGEVPSPTKVTDEYDYAVVRLARPIGRQSHRRSGGVIRGWLPLENKIDVFNAQRRILVFQHPQKAPQQFDIGEYVRLDPSGSRVWYTVSTSKGSSGGAAVDTEGRLFALHNAEVLAKVDAANGRRVN